MNSVYKNALTWFLIFPLLATTRMVGDDALPAYLKEALNSQGQLSMAVEKPADSLSSEVTESFNPDDLPFHVETEKNVVDVEKTESKKTTAVLSESVPAKTEERSSENIEPEQTVVQELPSASVVSQAPDQKPVNTSKTFPEIEAEPEALQEAPEQNGEEIVFNFENADLSNLVSYIETLFDVQFITDDTVKPMGPGGKLIEGNKISFKTHEPLSKEQAWSLFLLFLDMAGLSVVQTADQGIYRITATQKAKRGPIQSFIGVDSELLPDNDTKIRYVYFIKDAPIQTLNQIVNSLKSSTAEAFFLTENKAFIITDSSYNIKCLMRIIRELDKVSMPQAMSVLKLKRVDAAHVKKLYDDLVRPEQSPRRGRLFGPRRAASALYFPENARIVVEVRTNSLILLGTREEIAKIEDFIINHVDVEAGTAYSPLHVYELKYADAAIVANIMSGVTQFGKGQPAGKVGGVRGEDKYFKAMSFTPEPNGNRLVIRGDYEDFLKAKEIIEKLDEPQPQVAIEVLILSVGLSDIRELGSQLRNKAKTDAASGVFGKNVNFQTSGIRLGGTPSTVVQDTTQSGAKRLLGDLISLVTGAIAGNTVVSLGSDAFGVWGIFNALKTVSNLQVISNPFLVATNKTEATVTLGEIRNVVSATIETNKSVPTYSDRKANLTVTITPQINSDGMIIMDLKVTVKAFRDDSAAAIASSAITEKIIETHTIVADKEVLALGGLIKNKIEDNVNKVPVLGNIPILGWLFKNKRKRADKEDLLVLISARIIDPRVAKEGDEFTQGHVQDYKSTIGQMGEVNNRRDPIDRAFFVDAKDSTAKKMDKFIFKRDKKKKKKKKRRKRKKKTRLLVKNGGVEFENLETMIAKKSKKSNRRSRKKARRLARRKALRSKNVVAQAPVKGKSDQKGST